MNVVLNGDSDTEEFVETMRGVERDVAGREGAFVVRPAGARGHAGDRRALSRQVPLRRLPPLPCTQGVTR